MPAIMLVTVAFPTIIVVGDEVSGVELFFNVLGCSSTRLPILQVILESLMLDVTSETVKSVAFCQFSGLSLHHVASVPVAVCICLSKENASPGRYGRNLR